MDYNRSTTDLNAIVITAGGHVAGDILPFQTAAQNAVVGAIAGVPLGIGTYVLPISSPSGDSQVFAQTSIAGVHLAWSTGLAGAITLQLCNFPGFFDKFGRGGADVADIDTGAGNWLPWNPTVSPTDVVSATVTGSGNSATKVTITAGGTAAGGAFIDFAAIGLRGARRAAIKVVTTAAGILRANACGKLGS